MNNLIEFFVIIITLFASLILFIVALRLLLWIGIKIFISCKNQYLRETNPHIAIAEKYRAIMKEKNGERNE